MIKGMSATDSRVRLGEVINDLSEQSDPVLVETEEEPIAIGVPQESLDDMRTGSIPANWEEIVEEARQIMQRWLKGAPMPDIRELIDFGRE